MGERKNSKQCRHYCYHMNARLRHGNMKHVAETLTFGHVWRRIAVDTEVMPNIAEKHFIWGLVFRGWYTAYIGCTPSPRVWYSFSWPMALNLLCVVRSFGSYSRQTPSWEYQTPQKGTLPVGNLGNTSSSNTQEISVWRT